MNTIKKEEWKDIPNYQGMYQVSNQGRVKSLPRKNRLEEKILKPNEAGKQGYFQVCLIKDKQAKRFYVHQLVCMAFLGHVPQRYVYAVDHINHRIHDNRLENLQVISHRANPSKRIGSSSKHQGVSKIGNGWCSRIYLDGTHVYLGYFKEEVEAALAYQTALSEHQFKQIAA